MKILFVCTGNTCRSYMAETIARSYIKGLQCREEVHFLSAGIYCPDGEPAAANARAVLVEMGYQNDRHLTRSLNRSIITEVDLILVMTRSQLESILEEIPEAEGKIYLLKDYALQEQHILEKLQSPDIMDPFGGGIENYRLCAQEIEGYIAKAIDRCLKNNKK